MTINQNEYFDIYNLLVNELIGGVDLFTIIGMVAILIFCLKYNISWPPTLLLEMLFLCIIVAITFNPLIWVFVVLLVGILFYYYLSQATQR